MTVQVIFSHGKESGPWGTKIKRLAETAQAMGAEVESIDYRDSMDPDIRAQKLQTALRGYDPNEVILVGSSMGGYVSLQAGKKTAVRGIFVLAPAIYMPGYEHKAPTEKLKNLAMVHGWDDEVIPVEHSLRFAQAQQAQLHLVADDHRLINSLDSIDTWFNEYLRRLI